MNSSVSYAKVRQNLKSNFDKVCIEREPLLIKRRNGGNVVIISEEDYSSMNETFYLLKSPKNALRLLQSLGRQKDKRKQFDNIEEVSDAIGI